MCSDAVENRGRLQLVHTLDHLVTMRGDEEILTPHEVRIISPEEHLSLGFQPRLFSLGIEPEPDLHDVVHYVTVDRGIVKAPTDHSFTRGDAHSNVLGSTRNKDCASRPDCRTTRRRSELSVLPQAPAQSRSTVG